MVYFWNITASYNGMDLSKVEEQQPQQRSPLNLFVKVEPSQVPLVRSIHEIHLTENAQIYAIIIGPVNHTFVDNAGIMTYYAVKHLTPEEDIEYTENERLIKQKEEQDKKAKEIARQAEREQ